MIDRRRPRLKGWRAWGVGAFSVAGIVLAIATPVLVWWTIRRMEREALRTGDAGFVAGLEAALQDEIFVYLSIIVGVAAVTVISLARLLLSLFKDDVERR